MFFLSEQMQTILEQPGHLTAAWCYHLKLSSPSSLFDILYYPWSIHFWC